MEQLKFIEFLKNNGQSYLLVEYNRKRFICEISRHTRVLELEQLEEAQTKLDL